MGNGILFITNQRLLFLGRKGFFNKETRVVHTIRLDAITHVEVQGRLRRRVQVIADEEEDSWAIINALKDLISEDFEDKMEAKIEEALNLRFSEQMGNEDE